MTAPPQRQTNSKVNQTYIDFIQAQNRMIMCNLFQFTSSVGAQDYFTDFDQDVGFNGQVWKSGSLRIVGMRRKIGVGLQVDEQDMKIYASPTDTLWGGNFLLGAREGLLDGAFITRYQLSWALVTGNAAYDTISQTNQIAGYVLSSGYVGTIDKGGVSHVEMKVRSPLVKLEVNMPRNYYQPGCLWDLYSAGCTANKLDYQVFGEVGLSGANFNTIPCSGGVINPTSGDGLPTYGQGRLTFTSGDNSGLTILISSNDTVNLYLQYPLSIVPNPFDAFIYLPGCSKSFNTCQLKFNNAANFRGFDKVPPVMLSI